MKALILAPFLPHPALGGGHAQVWSWMRHLSSEHELALVGFCEREDDLARLPEVERFCAAARVRLRCPTPTAGANLTQLPAFVRDYYARALADDVRAAAAHFQPHVVLFAATNMAQYRAHTGDIPALVCALEINFVAYRRRMEAARGWARLRARADWLRMLRYETSVFRRAEHVVTMSRQEAEIVRAVAPRARVTAVPPGVEEERLQPRPRRPEPNTVLYLGHMEHYPNLDGLLHLWRDIWPLLRRAVPEARLVVAGRGVREELGRAAPEALADMDADPRVELAGFVPDLAELMDRTAALAAPLRLGGGVRNKVIESLAAGLPVVATSRAVEGLSVRHDREALIADTPETFARQLARLLTDPELQDRLSRAGRELAAREHDNAELARRVSRALMRAVGARR